MAARDKEKDDTEDACLGKTFRQIRAVQFDDEGTIRVYQAYNAAIADAAVAANSFLGPLKAGLWSRTRMTWIKPSAVWMAYRCGWTVKKDKNQARVLALDVSREGFLELLLQARLSHGGGAKKQKKCTAGEGSVTVQWDPERTMDPDALPKQVLTRPHSDVRSIQIGLRGSAVETLLDPTFVRRITDVTGHFRRAATLLEGGDVAAASSALWPRGREAPLRVGRGLRAVLCMDVMK